MASEDLLKKAVAAFKALSPEQQTAMLEEQRQSWVRGNVGLSRDERGMTSPVMHRPAPAATDTGLETIGRKERSPHGVHFSVDLSEGTELVTRSQAEAIIRDLETKILEAAISDRLDDAGSPLSWQECAEIAEGIISDLKADNTALIHDLNRIKDHETELVNDNAVKDARIKELENGLIFLKNWTNTKAAPAIKAIEAKLETYHEEYENRKEGYEKTIDSLEEKLAAAEKALEGLREKGRKVLDVLKAWEDDSDLVNSGKIVSDFRAVMGGKPS